MRTEQQNSFIDATLFMGMHSKDNAVRLTCKAFFADRIADKVVMSWEQVGRCDDLVWGYQRAVQDAYYPFMDNLHTDMSITRISYSENDVHLALTAPELADLPVHERLLLAQVMSRDGVRHTASPRLTGRTDLPIAEHETPMAEVAFPPALERLYQDSLVLTVIPEEL